MPGPPPTPIEKARREGNPGHRTLATPTILGGRISEEDLATLRAPSHMSVAERRAWREIIRPLVAGGILDRADLTLVELAAQALARARAARREVEISGLITINSQGHVANPAIAIEKGAMAEYRQFALLLGFGPSGRTRIGKSAGAKPDGGMAGELGRQLPARARLRMVHGDVGEAD